MYKCLMCEVNKYQVNCHDCDYTVPVEKYVNCCEQCEALAVMEDKPTPKWFVYGGLALIASMPLLMSLIANMGVK